MSTGDDTKPKAPRIRKLLAEGLTPREVAELVGCAPDYVRAVRNRDRSGGITAADLAYRKRNKERILEMKRERYAKDPEYRKRIQRNKDAWRRKHPERYREHQRTWYKRHKAKLQAAERETEA